MKIVMLSNCPLIESQGSGYVILTTKKAFIKLGHQVELIPPTKFTIFPKMQGRAHYYRMPIGMAIWVLKNRKMLTNSDLLVFYGAESWLAIWLIKFLLKLNIYTVLHTNGIELLNKININKYSPSNLNLRNKWNYINMDAFFTFAYKNVDKVITVSEAEKTFAHNVMKISPEKVSYLEPCINREFIKLERKYMLEKKNIITYCGRWTYDKGKHILENVIPKTLTNFPNYKFRLIGIGEAYSLEGIHTKKIEDKIEIFTFVESKEKLFDLYNESSIFIFPSLTESFGLAIAEAMYCGCAIICGPVGFGLSLISEKEALVLKELNNDSVYNALKRLILDKDFRNELGRVGKKRADRLTFENYTKNLNSILRAVTSIISYEAKKD